MDYYDTKFFMNGVLNLLRKERTLTASVENGEIVATKEVVIYGAPNIFAYQGGSKLVVGGVSRSYGVVATNGKNADQTAVTYSSSNPEVFTVDETGKSQLLLWYC